MIPITTVEGRAKALASRRRAQSVRKLIFAAELSVGPVTEALIAQRLLEMPLSCRNTYVKAMEGDSWAASVRAYCCMCLDWDDFRPGIRNCSDPACPLYPHRPYQDDLSVDSDAEVL